MVPELDLRQRARGIPASDFSSLQTTRATLRPGVKALLASGGKVLLVRERRTDGSAFWTLPGGGVEQGESYREALGRELAEEIQCRPVIDPAPVAACAYRHRSLEETVTLYSVYTGALADDPAPNAREGIVDCAWCLPSEPPDGTLRPFRRLLFDLTRL
jgi:8-oxo-dGTP diphosphatase